MVLLHPKRPRPHAKCCRAQITRKAVATTRVTDCIEHGTPPPVTLPLPTPAPPPRSATNPAARQPNPSNSSLRSQLPTGRRPPPAVAAPALDIAAPPLLPHFVPQARFASPFIGDSIAQRPVKYAWGGPHGKALAYARRQWKHQAKAVAGSLGEVRMRRACSARRGQQGWAGAKNTDTSKSTGERALGKPKHGADRNTQYIALHCNTRCVYRMCVRFVCRRWPCRRWPCRRRVRNEWDGERHSQSVLA